MIVCVLLESGSSTRVDWIAAVEYCGLVVAQLSIALVSCIRWPLVVSIAEIRRFSMHSFQSLAT